MRELCAADDAVNKLFLFVSDTATDNQVARLEAKLDEHAEGMQTVVRKALPYAKAARSLPPTSALREWSVMQRAARATDQGGFEQTHGGRIQTREETHECFGTRPPMWSAWADTRHATEGVPCAAA